MQLHDIFQTSWTGLTYARVKFRIYKFKYFGDRSEGNIWPDLLIMNRLDNRNNFGVVESHKFRENARELEQTRMFFEIVDTTKVQDV